MNDPQKIGLDASSLKKQVGINKYSPHPIANRIFNFRSETILADSEVTIQLVRFDEKVKNYPYRKTLNKLLYRCEAMATVCSDGNLPDLMQVLHFEENYNRHKASPKQLKQSVNSRFPQSSSFTLESSYEAFCCIKALKWIHKLNENSKIFSLDDALTLYKIAMRGTKREKESGIRKKHDNIEIRSNNNNVIYIAPPASQIYELLLDWVNFCNYNPLPPITKSATQHFQLEAIMPVNQGLDRWGRLIALLIQKNFGIITHTLPPFSITPASQTKTHTELLIPYKTNQNFNNRTAMSALDSWVLHSIRASKRSLFAASVYKNYVETLLSTWIRRVNYLQSNSLLEHTLLFLIGTPLISINSLAENFNKSYQAASDVVDELLSCQILEPANSDKRNRLFLASDAFCKLKKINDGMLPTTRHSREDFITARNLKL